MAANERALIRSAQRGDAKAFEAIVARYERVLFNLALRMVNDREDARDLTQTVFVKAYQRLPAFDPDRPFFSWVYRIMINESLNLLSRRRPMEPLAEQMESVEPSPEECFERARVVDTVQGAIMELSEPYREVIVLRHFLNLSHREMSDALRVPEKTVKSRLYSARQRLVTVLRRRGVVHA
ncbi:MAG TPA: sigma-70 family RNA polymerase sigma factor [Candidatus Eisenbacteria bacterium]|jgi:RNA polymerase sigma-70 factor (ECF subfamily)